MNNILQILQKQQELEYLKQQKTYRQVKSPHTSEQLFTPYVKCILASCKKQHRRNAFCRIRFLIASLLASVLLFLPLSFIAEDITVHHSTTEFITPAGEAQTSLEKGQISKARQILEENRVDPWSFAGAMAYSELYEKEEKYDASVNVILNFINNVTGAHSTLADAPAYQRLLKLKDLPVSKDVKNRCEACIQNCQDTTAQMNEISSLIEQKKYQKALDACNLQKQKGTSDATLFYDYSACYTALGEYEEYASYLISMEKVYQRVGVQAYYQYPPEHTIKNELGEIHKLVSKETQREIGKLGIL